MEHSANGLFILVSISVIIFTSPYFSKLFKIPIAPIEIMLGSVAGYFGFVDSQFHLLELVAEVGFFYLMFLAGTEVDLRIFAKTDKKVLRLGILYIAFLYLLSAIGVWTLDLNKLFILILPLMSVGLLLTLYKDYGKDQEWLNLAMLVGSIGEVISIALLTFSAALLNFGVGIELYKSIGYLTLFLGVSVVCFKGLNVLFWWYPELKIFLMPHHDKDEKDIRLSFALFFMVIAVMIFLNLEIAFGAFVAGTFIATFFEHKKELPHKLSSFGFGFLVPTFFIHIGSTFKVEALVTDGVIQTAFLITLGMFLIRFISAQVFAKHLNFKQVTLFAMSHSMPLTLLIAFATIAHKTGNIGKDYYFAFILASLLEAVISMISIKMVYASLSKDKLKIKN